MKVIIIEDETLSAEHLTSLLHKVNRNIEVVKYLDTVKAAIQAFEDGMTADLIFLDIHLADGNSFEIFSRFPIKIPVIFTTAYDHYAIKAFKQNSIDYLLKPINLSDIIFALDKFDGQHNSQQNISVENMKQTYQHVTKNFKTRFMVKLGQNIETVATDQIHHFDTKDSMSFLITNSGQRFPIDYTLDQLETLLPPKDFFRINRKVIIQFSSISKVNTYFNGRLAVGTRFLEGDVRVVSRERVNDFKLWLDDKI
ncbi:MAG TPA: LytTR family DNA-binding domain-containing protein [Saprospiraceae bacterium]|nr:LytTR family DNA-binding domain-containing protein [Saprospiraceae bacterium]